MLVQTQIKPLLLFQGLKSLTIIWSDDIPGDCAYEEEKVEKTKRQVQALVTDVVTRVPETRLHRDNVPTLQQALDASIAARKAKQCGALATSENEILAASGPIIPLMDDEIPQTEDELVRLALSRSKATLTFLQDAKLNRTALALLTEG